VITQVASLLTARSWPPNGPSGTVPVSGEAGRREPAYLDRTGIAEEVTGSAFGPPDGAACPGPALPAAPESYTGGGADGG
jgi:hypothetical protein